MALYRMLPWGTSDNTAHRSEFESPILTHYIQVSRQVWSQDKTLPVIYTMGLQFNVLMHGETLSQIPF